MLHLVHDLGYGSNVSGTFQALFPQKENSSSRNSSQSGFFSPCHDKSKILALFSPYDIASLDKKGVGFAWPYYLPLQEMRKRKKGQSFRRRKTWDFDYDPLLWPC